MNEYKEHYTWKKKKLTEPTILSWVLLTWNDNQTKWYTACRTNMWIKPILHLQNIFLWLYICCQSTAEKMCCLICDGR